MKIDIEREIDMKYEYLMNLVPRERKKTKLPYSVEVLDKHLTELENALALTPKSNKKDCNTIRDRITSIKSSITILIIGT